MTRPERRREIMQAAEKLFTTRRFHEITTDDVAKAAGVGKGTIYRYFEDKEDLFFETAMSGFDELCDLVRQSVTDQAPFVEQLVGACAEIGGFFARRRQLFRMMQAEDGRAMLCHGSLYERWLTHRQRLIGAVSEIIARGVCEGQIRGDIPAEVLTHFLLGTLRTRARDMANLPEEVRTLDRAVDVFLHGAAPAAPQPGKKGRQ